MIRNLIKTCSTNLIKHKIGIYGIHKRMLSVPIEEFEKAKGRLNKLKNDPGSEEKLKLYALFKQVTEGQCTKPRPGMTNFVDRAKWDAWSSLKDLKKEDAVKMYVSIVDGLIKAQGTIEEKPETDFGGSSVEGIKLTNENGVLTIRLNRPDKKNALTWEMYDHWADTLRKANDDKNVKVVVVTGSGDYFCSGNDLANFAKLGPNETPQQMAQKGNKVLLNFVASFIDFSKPLIALVNGPAIGITVTTLGLYDAVFASDNATFSTPFSALGQTPEGCSSVTFPGILGPMKANQMLMFNKQLSANEASGLVSQVIPHKVFHEEARKLVDVIASLPPQTLKYSKDLIRGPHRENLHRANKVECDRLMERWLSDECIAAITKFFSKKKG